MNKKIKLISIFGLALAVVLIAGINSASAALTFGATSVTTDGALTFTTIASSTVTLGAANTTGAITIGGTAQTGTLTLGSSSGTNIVNIAAGAGTTTVNIANAQVAGSVNIGAGMVVGTITIGGTAQTGTITLGSSSAAQTITIGAGAAAKTINIGTGNTSGAITIGGTSQTAVTTIYGGGTGSTGAVNAVSIVGTLAGTISGAGESHGLDMVTTGTLGSGGVLVGGNFAVTTAGTAGEWVSGIYAKVIQGTTKNVNGYISGAEFEVVNTNTDASDWFPLVLNANSVDNGAHSSYIGLRSYGTTALNSLLWIEDQTIGTTSETSLVSTGIKAASTHTLRIIIDDTPYWILLSNDQND